MGFIGIIKDSDEKQKSWRYDEVQKDCKDNFKLYNNIFDFWRCLIDNVVFIVILFVKNRKKYVINILEMNKM